MDNSLDISEGLEELKEKIEKMKREISQIFNEKYDVDFDPDTETIFINDAHISKEKARQVFQMSGVKIIPSEFIKEDSVFIIKNKKLELDEITIGGIIYE